MGLGEATVMRVLVVRSSPYLAGIERLVLNLAVGWQRQGWAVGLVTLYRRPPGGPPAHPLVTAARARGLRAWSVPDRGPLDLKPLRFLKHIMGEFRPHIVHTHDYKSDVLAAWLVPPHRHLISAHGYTDADVRQRVYRYLDLWVLRRAAAVVTPSVALAQALRRARVPAARVRVIPYGLDWQALEQEAARGPAPRSEGPVLAFAGRFSWEKGGDVLLRALARVPWPARATVWMIGDGPHRAAWERLARRLDLTPRVRFWGWQPRPLGWLRASTLVVVPSRREAFGLTAVEAQGLGRAVVATAVGGLPEVVAPACRLVPPEDPDALAAALAHWLHYPREAERAGRAARGWVRARFSLASCQTAYTRLLAQHGA